MSASVNKVILVGHLGADPEVRATGGGKAVANFRIATSEGENTEWHNIVAWEKTAENVGKYMHKGSCVYIEGRLQTRMYEKDGDKKYITEVVAQVVKFMDSKPADGEDRPAQTSTKKPAVDPFA